MFRRDILKELVKWKDKKFRKPLTTAIHLFAEQFDQYIYLNLEKEAEREIFEKVYSFPDLVTNIFIYTDGRENIPLKKPEPLE